MINQLTGRGLLLVAVALLFLLQAPNLTVGNLSRPGPGLFPVIISSILLVIGITIIGRSFLMERVPFEFHWRNLALIVVSLLSFALISEYVNMLAGIAVMTTIACYASEDFSIPRTATIVVVLCAIAWSMRRFLGVQLPLY